MLLVFAVVAEEFESSVSFLKSNSDCLYFCVSDFHSAADLVLSGLIDSVMVDLLSLCSLVHPTEASILLFVKRCSFLLLYAYNVRAKGTAGKRAKPRDSGSSAPSEHCGSCWDKRNGRAWLQHRGCAPMDCRSPISGGRTQE